MQINNLRELLEHAILDLYSSEKQITKALPKLAAETTDSKLKDALSMHLTQTEEHAVRIKKIMDEWVMTEASEECLGMKGVIDEGKELLAKLSEPMVKDAGIILAAQKVEHYEIATYGSAIQYAEILDLDETVKLLKMNMAEEKEADTILSKLAGGGILKAGINEKAAGQT